MIRPRTGDFLYSQGELKVMLADIVVFKGAGASGVVFGVLHEDASVDVERTQTLIDEALPMQVCFHRAFDMTRDIQEAFNHVSKLRGVTRILTSGHGMSVPASLPVLQELLKGAQGTDRPTILPGAGVNGRTARSVLDVLCPLGLKEIHMSGGRWFSGTMKHRPTGMGMGADDHEWQVWRTDEEAVREVRYILDEVL
ncbi:copper homeostasis CutC domain-containing protein [Amylostereum chailletii]|nr:copper homeostasis CutC domain-containing protein [Amylostereum chailletii]